jgi:hypothetical protein
VVAALGVSVNREVREQNEPPCGVDRQGHPAHLDDRGPEERDLDRLHACDSAVSGRGTRRGLPNEAQSSLQLALKD